MSKEIQTKQGTLPTTGFANNIVDDVFDDIQVDASDIVIPKLLLMQQSSQYVAADKAKMGDFVNSITAAKLGTIVDPIEIIPFYHRKSWDIVNKDDNNSYIRNEPFTAQNADLPWDDKEGAMNIRRIKRLDFFCMVPKLLKEGSILPVVVSFKSTSYKTGAIILTEWSEIKAKNDMLKAKGELNALKLPFSKSFILAGNKLTNDKKQTYCTSTVQVGLDVDIDTQKMCLQWMQTLKTSKNVVVDDSEERDASTTNTGADVGTGDF